MIVTAGKNLMNQPQYAPILIAQYQNSILHASALKMCLNHGYALIVESCQNLSVPKRNTEALSLETICVCNKKENVNDKLLKCHNEKCSSGKFFHLECMSYKRCPNNYKTSWTCSKCKLETICAKKDKHTKK